MTYNYIYVRANEISDLHNVYKVGRTTDLVSRNQTYRTGEYIPGKFIEVYRILSNKYTLEQIEDNVKPYFADLYRYHDGGGTEFYDKSIDIKMYLDEYEIKYHQLNDKELQEIERIEYNNWKKEKESSIHRINQGTLLRLPDKKFVLSNV